MRRARTITIFILFFILTALSTGPSTYAQTVEVYIETSKAEVSPGESFLAQVVIDPAGRGVSSVDITLSFDAKVLEALKVERGPLLGENVIELFSEINNTSGTVRYVAARVGPTTPPTPRGILISITFRVKQGAGSTKTILSIADIGLADEKPAEIKNIAIRGLTITISSMATTVTTSTTLTTTVTTTTIIYFTTHPPLTQTTTMIVERQETMNLLIILLAFLAAFLAVIATILLITSRRRERKPIVIGVR